MFKNVFKNKKVLITGDTGFKGSWLAIWLKNLGAEVYGYSLPPKNQKDNFVVTALETKINHLDGDVRDFGKLVDYFNVVQPDFAFHLAAQPLVIDSYENPKYTFETNIIGTVNFFESVRKCNSVKVAINITSDKCYQNNEWVWGYRENDAMGGKDPYSASKGASELITQAYLYSFFSKDNTANIASARAGNVIGGGDWADYRIVPDFFRALEKRESLKLRYPESTRPWQHVLEPLSGYLTLAMKLFLEGKKYSGGWNFGPIGTTNQSVRTLVEKMIEYSGIGKYEAPEINDKFFEASLLNLDISKAMHLLNWKPVLDFLETVKFTVDGYLLNNVTDIYNARISQINSYCKLAKNKNIEWATH
ncbi:CDP-glucose 4,6-dehydratase [Stygiobacter electus]|uniref:CDP-glucose 4,6-dehydratase n=1 Tax=Stygiobacter electus TaxID=3032292 RepID=A0AAE3NZU9_9BACT|nr:CDP-glucose 4,6-dehydratase [Stygiobacter electus]MDF1613086.1 CDP-glucose 4,6-dehydratase [Stygiobacter electus]